MLLMYVGTMFIDSDTAKNLELVVNALSGKQTNSLFGILDHCETPMAKRLLRSTILQPPNGMFLKHQFSLTGTVLEEITRRQDVVQGGLDDGLHNSPKTRAP